MDSSRWSSESFARGPQASLASARSPFASYPTRGCPQMRSRRWRAPTGSILVAIEAPRPTSADLGPRASLAHELLHRGVSPILCVPRSALALPRGPGAPFRAILAATDFSELGDRAVDYALALADATEGARVVVCHVEETLGSAPAHLAPEIRATLETRIAQRTPRAAGPPATTRDALIIARRTAADGIIEAAERLCADLVCIGSHGRGALGRLIVGSVAAEVVHQSNRPVLVVP